MAFDQQAFAEAVRIAVAAIAQACVIVSQGGSNDLQCLEAHRPPMVRGGVDSRVRTTMTREGEVDVMRGIQDMGVGTKRKEDPSSSNPGKKQKTSVSSKITRMSDFFYRSWLKITTSIVFFYLETLVVPLTVLFFKHLFVREDG